MMLSALGRPRLIQTLDRYEFDLLVIGGGITGAGIALDAVTRGLSVALVEMQDFSAGTSSRSTKLVHGGLRYLKQLEVQLVAEVGKEREIVYENAVHVTEPEWMLLPFHKGGTFGPFSTSAGLRVYDYLAGVKRTERRKMLSPGETLIKEPLLKKEGLRGGGYYVEYRTDDARLTLETIKKAAEKGAICINYLKVESFIYDKGSIAGAVAADQLSKRTATIHAKRIVNATGPWVDMIRSKDALDNKKHLKLTKGVHAVVDQSHFPLQQAVYFDAPDGRMIFAIPREGKAYIGTTDTFFEGNPENPDATKEDIEYLLNAVSYMFPTIKLSKKHVESTWAGVRPLIHEEGKDPSEISRRDEIWESQSGLITIAGGKLTGYRKMAETAVDRVIQGLPSSRYGKSITKHLPLSGGDVGGSRNFQHFIREKAAEGTLYGLTYGEAERLAAFYGSNCDHLFAYANVLKHSTYGLPLDMAAQLAYAIQFEMACTPTDFFKRRTGKLYFNIEEVHLYKEQVGQAMKSQLGLSEGRMQEYLIELEGHLDAALAFRKGGDSW